MFLLNITGTKMVVLTLISMIIDDIKSAKQEREWRKNSFEFEGGRYAKGYFIVVDGKIASVVMASEIAP